jgi:hypothetical protein
MTGAIASLYGEGDTICFKFTYLPKLIVHFDFSDIKTAVIPTLKDMRFVENLTGISQFSGLAYSGEALFLGDGQSVGLTIDNTGDDRFMTYTNPSNHEVHTIATDSQSDKTTLSNIVNGDFSNGSFGWSIGDNDIVDEKLVIHDLATGLVASQSASYFPENKYELRFDLSDITNNSDGRYRWVSDTYFEFTPEAKTFIHREDVTITPSDFRFRKLVGTFSGFTVDNVTAKEYLQPELIYTMRTSFSNLFVTDVEPTEADRALIKERPEIIAILVFTGVQNGLSFSQVNVKHCYLANEGVIGGDTLYDIVTNGSTLINGFTDKCRTAFSKSPYGLQSMLFVSDANGKATGMTKDNTIALPSTASIHPNIKLPADIDYTIMMMVEGHLAQFGPVNEDMVFISAAPGDGNTGTTVGNVTTFVNTVPSESNSRPRVQADTSPINAGDTFYNIYKVEITSGTALLNNINASYGSVTINQVLETGLYYFASPVKFGDNNRVRLQFNTLLEEYSVFTATVTTTFERILTNELRREFRTLRSDYQYFIDSVQKADQPLPNPDVNIEITNKAIIGYPDIMLGTNCMFKIYSELLDQAEITAEYDIWKACSTPLKTLTTNNGTTLTINDGTPLKQG